jgi:thiamine pyrophosphate-dependent acetolactate synthase large subunit-like protein
VVNTWGAKGVLRWDDPRHHGTAGLQARDFELAGLGGVDVLVTCGLDADEVTARPWEGRAEVVDLAPEALAEAAGTRSWPAASLERPPLYTDLAAVCGPLYERVGSAAQRARALARSLPEGAVVVAEPGLVGFWVARTFPTTAPGSVVVPARGGRAAAWEAAQATAAAGRAVVLVAHEPVDLVVDGLVVEVWGDGSVDLDPAPLVAVAGEIVAWGGRSS